MPVPSRIVVGCHSVMRLATSEFVDSPTAYPHTAGPKGVTQAAATLTSAMSSVRCAPAPALGDVLEPGEAEHDGREEEAAVEVRPDEHQEGDRPQTGRMAAPLRDEDEQDREAGHAQQLRAKREGRGRDGERAERQRARRSAATGRVGAPINRMLPKTTPTSPARNSARPVQPPIR